MRPWAQELSESEAALRALPMQAETDAERARLLDRLVQAQRALGQYADAVGFSREAVQIRRRQAEADPAFLPRLAVTLTSLGGSLSALGQHEEARASNREAVQILRHLSEARAEPLWRDLAGSLHNLAHNLHHLGQGREALAAQREALQLFLLCLPRQTDVEDDLWTALGSLCARLEEAGENPEADLLCVNAWDALPDQEPRSRAPQVES